MPRHTSEPVTLTEQVASLLGTAQVYTGDPRRAESLVRGVLQLAGADHAPVDVRPRQDLTGLHRQLWRCWQAGAQDTSTSTSSAAAPPLMRDALAALPPAARAAVHLVDVEGLSYAQLATVLGTDRDRAAALLHDARRRLLPAVTSTPTPTTPRSA